MTITIQNVLSVVLSEIAQANRSYLIYAPAGAKYLFVE
jgi:hypothetical protein